ncbi:MAG: glycosyltransferase [Candidatus Omnitrophota bacterium]
MKISIIIPVFNEQGNLTLLNSKIQQMLESEKLDFEIIYINDGSKDNSLEELAQICSQNVRVKIINLIRNYGQTQAIAAGVDNAAGEVIITMDADLQNDPKDIPKILEKINQGFEVVSGWRVNRKDGFLLRVFPSYIANLFFSALTKVKLHDLGCSLKGYKKEILEKIEFFGQIHRFLPICAAMYGAKITEIPVKHHKRLNGKSKYGTFRVFNVILDMLTLMFMWKFTGKPVYIFGGIGMFSFGLSLFLAIFIIIRKLIWGGVWVSPLLFLFIMFFIIGMQFILMGILAELIIRLYYGSQDRKRYRIKEIKSYGEKGFKI